MGRHSKLKDLAYRCLVENGKMDLSAIYLKLSDSIKSQGHRYQSLRMALDGLCKARFVCIENRYGINYYYADPETLKILDILESATRDRIKNPYLEHLDPLELMFQFAAEPFPYGAQSWFDVRHATEVWPRAMFVVFPFSGRPEIGRLEQRYGALGIRLSTQWGSKKTLYIKNIHSIFRIPPDLESSILKTRPDPKFWILRLKSILRYMWGAITKLQYSSA